MTKNKEPLGENHQNSDGDGELLTVFVGDLYSCKERLETLEEEGIEAVVEMSPQDAEGVPPLFELKVKREDLEEVAEIFAEIWEEILKVEGITEQTDGIIDLSQETVTCPGCLSVIDCVTEDGECPECGLFLGLPDEENPAEIEK